MADYKEKIIEGQYSEYQRAHKVIISNELGQLPTIDFMEQVLATLPSGDKLTVKWDKCMDTMGDPTETFPMLNPMDDSVIGSATYQDSYVLLYSMYRYVASKRDAARGI